MRHRRDAACVRDSEYVMEPRALMPAAPPRPSPGVPAPSTPLGQGSHPGWTAKGVGGSPIPLHCCHRPRAPQHRHPASAGGRPSSAPGRGPQAHPSPGVGGRVTARRANGEEARRGRACGAGSGRGLAELGRKSVPSARRRAEGPRSVRTYLLTVHPASAALHLFLRR